MMLNKLGPRALLVLFGLTVISCGSNPAITAMQTSSLSAEVSGKTNKGTTESQYAVNGAVRVTRRLFSVFRPTYDVKQGEQLIGVIQQKLFAATSTWRLMDAGGADIGMLEQAAFSFGYKGLVRTMRGTVVGTVRQDVWGSMIRPGVVLRLLDEQEQVVLRSAPVYFSMREDVKLYDAGNVLVGRLIAPWFSWNQARDLHMEKALDHRMLLAFLSAQIDTAHRDNDAKASPRPSPTPSSTLPTTESN